MDARLMRTVWIVVAASVIAALLNATFLSSNATAAAYRTTNFVVQAPTPALAREVGESAEQWRSKLAIQWLGKEMPAWSKPCPIKAKIAPHLGAGGATSFIFDQGEVFGWEMDIQGSRERILDSVLPHEVTHTIFASHFRQPLPRWADEGACTTVEHQSEIVKQERMLIRFLKTGKGIPFSKMFAMKEYPPDVMPLYSQGHSLTQFLIEQHGREKFLSFLGQGMSDENWPMAVQQNFGHRNLYELQNDWLAWVKDGRPRLARVDAPANGRTPTTLVSNQSPQRVVPTNSVYASRGKRVVEPTPDDSILPAGGSQPLRTPQRGSAYGDARINSGTYLR